MTGFDCARWSSCRGQHAACARRLGGGPAHDGLFTSLVRAPERTGDSPPRHIPRPPSLRVHQCVSSSVRVRPCLARPHPSTSSGSAFPIKNGSVFQIGITPSLASYPDRTLRPSFMYRSTNRITLGEELAACD